MCWRMEQGGVSEAPLQSSRIERLEPKYTMENTHRLAVSNQEWFAVSSTLAGS